MTIHFHSKHFESTGLELIEYMILLIFEQTTPVLKDISKALNISERTTYRTLDDLIKKGYLIKNKKKKYEVTDKMYPKH